ncbi:aromatic amino acid lyase [Streptomyces caniscabiei]|uniref:aromatic amino acid lyase n=1 Tax=Streptomyces caniscabiei TaxID=2746961 RepID=UPI0038D3A220
MPGTPYLSPRHAHAAPSATLSSPTSPAPAVRALMLVRPASLSCGRSAVTPGVLDFLATVLRTNFAPAVTRLGFVGAAGGLIPLVRAAQALVRPGRAYGCMAEMPGAAALDRACLQPQRAAAGLAVARP